MPVIEIDKDSDSIIFIEDGKRSSRSIRKEDTIISVAPEGFKKILLMYIEIETGKLVVIHEE